MEDSQVAGRERYRVYTNEFDEVVDVEDILSEGRMKELHRQVTAARTFRGGLKFEAFENAAASLPSTLGELFEASGLNPRDTSVVFAIDTSGSTRGDPIFNSAISIAETCVALEELGVETTVLGYTTTSWKGGESRKKWLADGRPREPGRLCDLLHVVYKTGDIPAASNMERLYAVAAEETKKENVDGEALLWAYDYAMESDRPNRLLVNLTDSFSPIDDATKAANSHDPLFTHLVQVCEAIEDEAVVSLTRVVVSPYDGIKDSEYQRAQDAGWRFDRHAVAGGERTPEETLSAIIDGLSLGLERAAELNPETAASYSAGL